MLLKGALVKVTLNVAKITQNAVTELLINSVLFFKLLVLTFPCFSCHHLSLLHTFLLFLTAAGKIPQFLTNFVTY